MIKIVDIFAIVMNNRAIHKDKMVKFVTKALADKEIVRSFLKR